MFPSIASSHVHLPVDMYSKAAEAAYKEIQRALVKHPDSAPFNSLHEGYGILKEEVDEMWDEIKKDNHELTAYEAIQVAAMALRIAAEFGQYPFVKSHRPLKPEING